MSDDDWKCDHCHEWNESVSHWKLNYKIASEKLEAANKRIEELKGALSSAHDDLNTIHCDQSISSKHHFDWDELREYQRVLSND